MVALGTAPVILERFSIGVNMTQPTIKVPEKTLTVVIGTGEETTTRELFMSWGLLDKLVNRIKDTDQIAEIFINGEIRNAILTELLAERTRTGKIISTVSLDDLDIDLEQIDNLLSWASEHITSFFLRSLSRLSAAVEKSDNGELNRLMSQTAPTS